MKKLKERLLGTLNFISSLELIPKIFYSTLLIIIGGVVIYSLILNPKTLIFISTLLLTICLRDLIKNYVFNKNTTPIDPISYIITLAYIILDRNFNLFSPVVLWNKRKRNITYIRNYKTYFSCFSNTLIHLTLFALGIILAKALSIFGLFFLNLINFRVVNLSTLLSQVILSFIIVNLNFIIMNMIPIAPFDMGIYLESLRFSIFESINNIGSVLIFICYYLGFIDNIFIKVYGTFINYFSSYVR